MATTDAITNAITLDNQLDYTGKGYLDAKMQPVNTVTDLNGIPRAQRFIGLTVTVLDDGSGVPHEYWLKEKVSEWVLKEYADLSEYATTEEIQNISDNTDLIESALTKEIQNRTTAISGVTTEIENIKAIVSGNTTNYQELNTKINSIETSHIICGDDFEDNN